MKKFAALLGAFGASVGSAFAEEAVLDTTALDATITQLGSDLEGWVANLLPVLAGVAGAFLVIWLLRIAIRIFRSFWSAR